MLSESSFLVNHWITVLWLIAAGLYTLFAVGKDMMAARKGTGHLSRNTSDLQ